ncbi:predicted protein [Plenodomus lingam JN3]|uniref:Uncharacterized protein n=1 Tax=Leptosphaeria maculans (strain JN3 / isolate v23.1.3 / race Av1-4-5-6-7-8) TaxID=985895 RepID=E5A7N8_LEPMJ|nr:predicted protein [Plenodomus lingam JN3]CBX99633.1 predicted protein [Plenodomus lingam JN3]
MTRRCPRTPIPRHPRPPHEKRDIRVLVNGAGFAGRQAVLEHVAAVVGGVEEWRIYTSTTKPILSYTIADTRTKRPLFPPPSTPIPESQANPLSDMYSRS